MRQLLARRRRLARGLSDPERTLRGVLLERGRCCSSVGCRCRRGELHGPYTYLAIYSEGRGRTIYLPQALAPAAERDVRLTHDKRRAAGRDLADQRRVAAPAGAAVMSGVSTRRRGGRRGREHARRRIGCGTSDECGDGGSAGEDQQRSSGTRGGDLRAAVDAGAGARSRRVDPAPVRALPPRRAAGMAGRSTPTWACPGAAGRTERGSRSWSARCAAGRSGRTQEGPRPSLKARVHTMGKPAPAGRARL